MLLGLVIRLVDVYSLVVFVGVILSWIPGARDNRAAQWVAAASEPVLERIRRVVPPMGGLDISPMLLLVGLQLLKSLLRSL